MSVATEKTLGTKLRGYLYASTRVRTFKQIFNIWNRESEPEYINKAKGQKVNEGQPKNEAIAYVTLLLLHLDKIFQMVFSPNFFHTQ